MPTGYTDAIKNGITFKEFALGCARAFGACIEMRDEPANTPIPEEFKPDDYHQKAVENCQQELAKLKAMTAKECEAKLKAERAEQLASYQKGLSEKKTLRKRYEAMLEQVNAWEPPSDDHKNLKEFMQQQITGSIDFDCNDSYYEDAIAQWESAKPMTAKEWKASKIAHCEGEIEYHAEGQQKANELAKGRTRWVKQLRESFDKTPVAV